MKGLRYIQLSNYPPFLTVPYPIGKSLIHDKTYYYFSRFEKTQAATKTRISYISNS